MIYVYIYLRTDWWGSLGLRKYTNEGYDTDRSTAGFAPLLKTRTNITIITASPPTFDNWDNYLPASLQAVYDFSDQKSRIKAVLLCNPHNPLGRCYPKKVLLEVMEFCQEHGLHLIVDEIYALMDLDLNDGGEGRGEKTKFVSALSLTEPLVPEGAVKIDPSRVHVVWSASKLFGMSGFRVVSFDLLLHLSNAPFCPISPPHPSMPSRNPPPFSKQTKSFLHASILITIIIQGCIISQQNPSLTHALSLLTSNHVANSSTLLLTHLLTWPQLPTLLSLTSSRLSASYSLLSTLLSKHAIPFIPPSHGLFLFARLCKTATSAVDEEAFFEDMYREAGVRVSEGRNYKGVEGKFGWARVTFSLAPERMREGCERLDGFLGRRG